MGHWRHKGCGGRLIGHDVPKFIPRNGETPERVSFLRCQLCGADVDKEDARPEIHADANMLKANPWHCGTRTFQARSYVNGKRVTVGYYCRVCKSLFPVSDWVLQPVNPELE